MDQRLITVVVSWKIYFELDTILTEFRAFCKKWTKNSWRFLLVFLDGLYRLDVLGDRGNVCRGSEIIIFFFFYQAHLNGEKNFTRWLIDF